MIRSTLLAMLLVLAGSVFAAEQVEIKPPEEKVTKEVRIAQVKRGINTCRLVLKTETDEWLASLEKRGLFSKARSGRNRRDKARADLPVLTTELSWLEGRLTLAGAESAVKAREADLAKAKPDDPGRAGIETALAEARRELEQVKTLEAGKGF